MEANVLSSEKVESRRQTRWYRDREAVLVCGPLVDRAQPGRAMLTQTRPVELLAKAWLLLVDLEPDGAVARPAVDGGPAWYLGEPKAHRAGVVDGRRGAVGEGGAGSDVECSLGWGGCRLEAAYLLRCDIPYEPVGLPVVCPSDILPIASLCAADNKVRERVCIVSASVIVAKSLVVYSEQPLRPRRPGR